MNELEPRDEFADMEDELKESQTALNEATRFIRDARKTLALTVLAATEQQQADLIAEAQKLTDTATTAVKEI